MRAHNFNLAQPISEANADFTPGKANSGKSTKIVKLRTLILHYDTVNRATQINLLPALLDVKRRGVVQQRTDLERLANTKKLRST